MMDLNNTRRRRKAVELICEKLEIDDKELNDFISGVNVKVSKEAVGRKSESIKAKTKEADAIKAKAEKDEKANFGKKMAAAKKAKKEKLEAKRLGLEKNK